MLAKILGDSLSKSKAKEDTKQALDSLIWYAGIADKWEQMTGNLNPVAGEYFNISHQESLGIVFTLNSDENSLNQLGMELDCLYEEKEEIHNDGS